MLISMFYLKTTQAYGKKSPRILILKLLMEGFLNVSGKNCLKFYEKKKRYKISGTSFLKLLRET